jgi:hypothetical protein
MSDTKRRKPEEFSDAIFIRCPPSLRAAIAGQALALSGRDDLDLFKSGEAAIVAPDG